MTTVLPGGLSDVQSMLRERGLATRGALHPGPDDAVPAVGPGVPTGTVVLAGGAGPGMFRRFSADRGSTATTLDEWSAAVLGALAQALGGRAVFPFERPYLPFQRWAMRAEACQPSPLGILIHPDYGLWHSYRGALLLPSILALPPADTRPSPCVACADRPCLVSCPVDAFTPGAYDVPKCARHLVQQAGNDCMEHACRARRACPVGHAWRYEPAQARFHMQAFRAKHG